MNHHIALVPSMLARPRLVLLVSAVGLSALLTACGTRERSPSSSWLTPYRPDIVQGNFISREQVAQLRPGLSRLQVRNLLGTPLVASVFHADRWDYVFSFQRRGAPTRTYRYTVFFQGEELVRFEGDAMPSEAEFIAQLDARRNLGKAPVLQATPEQLKAAQAPSARKPAAPDLAAAPPVTPSATNYPPLEGARP